MNQNKSWGGEIEIGDLYFGCKKRLLALTREFPGTWTASGRGALSVVVKHLIKKGIKKYFLPSFGCSSIISVFRAEKVDYSFYPVDYSLGIDIDPPKNSATLIIDYFGWLCDTVDRIPNDNSHKAVVIEDASQALLSKWSSPRKDRFIILSPRKFIPSVLSGWCSIEEHIKKLPLKVEKAAFASLAARTLKSAYLNHSNPEVHEKIEEYFVMTFYAIEKILDSDPSGYRLPEIFSRILAGANMEKISIDRRHNWMILHKLLSGFVEPMFNTLPLDVVPLGYVIKLKNRNRVREGLAKNRIYCPVHWPLPNEINKSRFPEAVRLSRECLTIPIDQRYGAGDMEQIADKVMKVV